MRPKTNSAHIVIIGGGFAGLTAARALSRLPVQITIVDRRNYHLFKPLLYQVATAALNPADIASPIRRILRHKANVAVVLGEAESIVLSNRKVLLRTAEIDYDYLVIAAGATYSYFGHEQWREAAPGLNSIEDAIEIRRRVLAAYEAAELEPHVDRQQTWLTFVIVGGGPTGVELAGALAEISRRVLARDFRRIDARRARIILIEAGPRILPAMSPPSSRSAQSQLERLGVEVMTGAAVTMIDDNGVTHTRGYISTRTAIWAAGVAASPLGRKLDAPLDRAGRVQVTSCLSVPRSPEAFVIGDLAAVQSANQPVPGLATAAMQEGRHVALNIGRSIQGRPMKEFRYRDKGVLATIGRAAAVAEIAGLRLSGFIAWLVWLFVHIMYLIGFRNKVIVVAEWAWVYLRNERGSRLITGDVEALIERGRLPTKASSSQAGL
jgi:NADH dehydrogenase